MKHRISQIDGTIDSDSEYTEYGLVTKKLYENSNNCVSQTYYISVKEKKGMKEI